MPLLSGFKWLTVESPAEQALRHKIAGYAIWLDFFRPFSPVEEFYVSRRPGLAVAFALAGATGEAEILLALRSVFFEETKESAPLKETTKSFLAARSLSHSSCYVSAFSVDRF